MHLIPVTVISCDSQLTTRRLLMAAGVRFTASFWFFSFSPVSHSERERARQISSGAPSCRINAAFRRGWERRIYAPVKNFVVRPERDSHRLLVWNEPYNK